MAKEKNGSSEPQRKILEFNTTGNSEEKPVKKRKGGWVIGLLVVILVAAGIGYGIFYQNRFYNDYEVLSTKESTDATKMEYLAYNGSLIKYGQEGISYLDKDGSAVWVESYKMKQPVAVVSEKYIAVADLNGNHVYILNETGKVTDIETPYTICSIDVASQGVFAVILENETENYIELYDKNGNEIAKIRTTIAESGYPLDISLSNDGTKLVSSYITVEGIAIQNTIAAYNFGEVGQNTTDRLVGGFNNLGDTIVPKIEFLNNDLICAFGDNQFIFYSMKEKPSEKGVISGFENEIQSIFYNSKLVGIIEKNSGTEENKEEHAQYRMRIFDSNGTERFSRTLDFSYNQVYATENEIIIVGNSECQIYDFYGKLKFSYCFPREVRNIIPTGADRKYIVVYDDSTEIIKLQYTEEDGEKVQ